MIDPWLLPDPEDLPDNNYYIKYQSKSDQGYSMDTEKNDNNNNVSPEEMEKIEKFLESINPLINPPND